MCRFIAYKGAPILLDDLLFRPKHSLIKQSFEAREIEEPLNGDGFGIGWFAPEITHTPAIFTSMTPAWSNRNLKNLASHIKSTCIFAHVRAASVGDISEANCHPFRYKQWIFMHNGGIEEFPAIIRKVRQTLSDEVYSWLKGQTDSEHFFAQLLDRILPKGDAIAPKEVMAAIEDTIRYINKLKADAGLNSRTELNVVISNGEYVVGTRYSAQTNDEPLSLYYSTGTKYVCEGDVCRMVKTDPKNQACMIGSEKLTDVAEDWRKVAPNQFVVINPDLTTQTRAMKI